MLNEILMNAVEVITGDEEDEQFRESLDEDMIPALKKFLSEVE